MTWATDGNLPDDAVVVCLRVEPGVPEYFDDNVYGHCMDCGAKVMFRPYIPRRAQKICVQCYHAMLALTPQ